MPQAGLVCRDDRALQVALQRIENTHAAKPGAGDQDTIRVLRASHAHLLVQRFDRLLDARPPGSFGSLTPDGLDGCQSVFGEVLEAFDHLEAEPSYEGERGVAASCEHLGGMPGVSAGVVFATGDVANVMKTVLDAPMRA